MHRRLTVALLAALALLSPALVPATAQAATAGRVTPGDPLALTLAAGDVAEYDVTVPGGAVPALTLSAVAEGTQVSFDLLLGAERLGGGSSGAASSPYLELPRTAAGADREGVLRVTATAASALTVVLTFAVDDVRDIPPGDLVPLTFDVPGGRAVLSFDSGFTGEINVAISGDTLTPAASPTAPRPRVTVLDGAGEEFQQISGTFFPRLMSTAGRQTVVIDPAADLVGTLTVRVSPVPQTQTFLTYGGGLRSVFLPLSRPERIAFRAVGGAPTLVQGVGTELTAADGGPGGATVELTLSGQQPVTLGRIGPGATTFSTQTPLEDGREGWLTVVPDEGTSGLAQLRIRLDPGPLPAVPVGTTTRLEVAAGAPTARWVFEGVAPGDVVELFSGPATFTDPDVSGLSDAYVESPTGATLAFLGFGRDGGAPASFAVEEPGTYTLVVPSLPTSDVAVDLLAARATTTVTAVESLPFTGTLTLDAPGVNAALTVTGRAGERLAVTLVDEGVTGYLPEQGVARVTFQDENLVPVVADATLGPGGTLFLRTDPLPQDGTYRLTVDGTARATGSIRVTLDAAQDVTGQLAAAGTPTVVQLERPGSRNLLSFDGTAGDRFALTVDEVTLAGPVPYPAVQVTVLRPDGSVFAGGTFYPGDTGWVEPLDSTLDASGSWTVLVEATGGATGSVRVARVAPRTVTSALRLGSATTLPLDRPGDVRRLTFTGAAGARPVLEILENTVNPRTRLLAPSGLVLVDDASYNTSGYRELPELTESGTWTLELDPDGAETGSVTLRLTLVTDPVSRVEVGERVRLSYATGQNPTLRVRLTAGRRVALDLTGTATTPVTSVTFVRPDGSVAHTAVVFDGARSWLEMPDPADVTGRWTIRVDPSGPGGGRFTATVRSASDQVIEGRLGRTTTVAVTAPPRNVVLPFTAPPTATSAPFVTWDVTDSTFDLMLLRVVSSDGVVYAQQVVRRGSASGSVQVFGGIRGTWQVVVDPLDGQTGRATVLFRVTETG